MAAKNGNREVDKFANKGFGTVTESAANTLTFAEIQTQVDIFAKRAWVISRLEWHVNSATYLLLAASDDRLSLALTSSNTITTLTQSDPAVIDLFEIGATVATGVGFAYLQSPVIRDFTNMPGGGIIIAPRPLYVAAKGTSLASATTSTVRFYWQSIDLTPDEYLELVDFYRIVR